MPRTLLYVLLLSLPPAVAGREAATPGRDWPQFRGIGARGVSEGAPTPASWNVPAGERVKWKTAIPGLGHSSPIVFGDLVCVTTAISGKADPELKVGLYGDIKPVEDDSVHEWKVYCLDRGSGKVRWEQTAAKGAPKIKRHTKATHANSTMATDGDTLVAFFGSEGLYAYDLKTGTLRWKKDLGVLDSGFFMVPEAQWGFASSPVIHKDRVILQIDVQKDSFLGAFALQDGRELWRTPRQDVPTWSTPTVHVVNGQPQVLVNGMRQVAAYDFKTGKEIWTLSGGGDIPVPTPVVNDGLIFITNAHGMLSPVYAIKETASGNISLKGGETANDAILWSTPRDGGYLCTPLVYNGLVYVIKYNGILNVFDAKTGEKKYQQRLAGATSAFTSSPIANDGKVYVASEDGQVFVIKAGPTYEQLAMNEMNTPVLATPALSEGRLLLRTQDRLMAIGSK
jgi:outer membrane protein assembly factor BamB